MAKHEMEQRFETFAMTMPGAESIDALGLDRAPGQRADYLWRDRTVIVEVKTLRGDPQKKIDEMFDELRQREDFPLFFRTVPADKLLARLPDGEELLRKLTNKVRRGLEAAFRDAKYQIDNTKRLLGLDDALGLLVILNPDIEAYEPNDAGAYLSYLARYHAPPVSIDAIWLLSEAHKVGDADPCILIETDRLERFTWAKDWLSEPNERWAQFCGSGLQHSGAKVLEEVLFQRKSEVATGELTKEQRWEAEYRANPYLAEHDDNVVAAFGRELCSRLKRAKEQDDRVSFMQHWQIWHHFLVEAQSRALDMRMVMPDEQEPNE